MRKTIKKAIKKTIAVRKRTVPSSSSKIPEPILQAFKDGDIATLKQCLASPGADVNMINEYGETLLHVAFEFRYKVNMAVVKCLIDFGCDVNAKDQPGYTPLDCAIKSYYWHKNIKIVKYLIENASGETNYRALRYVIDEWWDYPCPKILKCLIANGFDGCKKDENGNSPRQLVKLLAECFGYTKTSTANTLEGKE